MYIFILKKSAVKDIEKLPSQIRRRILEKLKFYSLQENPFKFAERLKDSGIGDYRFRIGDYRVIFDVQENKIIILSISHKKIFINKNCVIPHLSKIKEINFEGRDRENKTNKN